MSVGFTVKTNTLEKTFCSVNLENHIFPNILIFKTYYVYIDTGSNIYFGELSVEHRTSISSLSFSTIGAVVMFQNMLKRLDCRKDTFN